MDNHKMKLIVVAALAGVLLYLVWKRACSKEHLTPGPPTLLSLQTDTVDIDSRLTDLKADFDKMKSQASAQAGNAAAARAQISATKYS